jgi:anti-sigma factor RsiW
MHQDWTDQLSAYLDDELDVGTRARLEEHLAHCPACAAVKADLERVVRLATSYGGHEPPVDLWPEIERRVDRSRVVPFSPAPPRPAFRRGSLAVAAVALLAVGLGGGLWLRGRLDGGAPAAVEPAVLSAVPAAAEAVSSAAYDSAVLDLERTLQANRSRLDTATVRVVEESIHTIDRAIAEARAAIQRDSANAYLNEQIAANMRRKLALLRVAARAASKET